MKNLLVHFASMALLLASCSSGQKITQSWVNPAMADHQPFKKVFLAVMTEDVPVKNFVETSLEGELREAGIQVLKSIDVFPPKLDGQASLSKEEMLQVIRERGCDAAFTLAVLDERTQERYHPGVAYNPMTPGWDFYGMYYDYYSFRYPIVYDPGYYSVEHTYLLESNLYDLATEQLVWTVQSSTFNPAGLSGWFDGYAKLMAKHLQKQGLLQN